MNYDGFFEKLRAQLAERYGQPIEAMLMVHRPPGTGGRAVARAFGSKEADAKLHINNALILTPTKLKIIALGGRSGIKPRDEVASWDRDKVVLDVYDTEHSTWM